MEIQILPEFIHLHLLKLCSINPSSFHRRISKNLHWKVLYNFYVNKKFQWMSVFGMKTFCMTPKSLLLKIKIIGLTTLLWFSNLLYTFLDLLCLKVVIRPCLSIFLVLYFIVLYFLVFYSQRSRIFISCPIYDNLFSVFHNLTKFF